MRYTRHHDRRTDRETPRRDAYTRARERRDASAGWREEYRHAGVATPDGGRYLLPDVGSRVRDRDADDGDELLVIDVLQDTRADEYVIDATGKTVSAHNPGRDPAAPVVVAAYLDDLEALDGWGDVAAAIAEGRRDVRTYSFPADRLAPIDDVDGEADARGGETA